MPRYFFNTKIGEQTVNDPEGTVLKNPDQAWEIAKGMILELLDDQDAAPELLSASLIVTDSDGDVVLEFPFSEALIEAPDTPSTRH